MGREQNTKSNMGVEFKKKKPTLVEKNKENTQKQTPARLSYAAMIGDVAASA